MVNSTVTNLQITTNNAPWDGIAIPQGFTLQHDGVFLTEKDKIADPVWVSAHTHNEDTGTYGLVISFVDRKGIQKELAFSSDVVHERGKGLAQMLAKNGLYIAHNKEVKLYEYLNNFLPDNWSRSVTQLGWIDSKEGKLEYLLTGDKNIIAKQDVHDVIFQPDTHSPTATTIYKQGSLDDWQKYIAEPCQGNPYLVFSICLALAGTLLKHAKTENGGFHFYGRSSRGKTTLAQVAASVYGCGADPSEVSDHSYVQRWNSTSNALEGLLAAHNDGVLVLDEIHTYHGKDFGKVVYNIVSGKAKARMNRDAHLTTQRTWRNLILSTGEISSQQKIEEFERSHAGQLLRLIDIPTHEAIIKNTHGTEPGQFALTLKQNCAQHFGTAGPEFVKGIVEKFDNAFILQHVLREEMEIYSTLISTNDIQPEHRRALRRFALVGVAGNLAVQLGILPYTSEQIENAICNVAYAWLSESAHIPDPVRGSMAIQQFILSNPSRFRDSHVQPANPASEKNLAGYLHRSQNEYWFLPDGFTEACGGHDVSDVAQQLRMAGFLRGESDRLTNRRRVQINGHATRIKTYVISGDVVEHDFSGKSPKQEETGVGGMAGQTI